MSGADEPGFFAARVAILGLGLMGGSLALALRGRCIHLTGIDPDPYTLSLAETLHLADDLAASPGKLLAQAEVVILATPVHTILDLLVQLPGLHPGPAVVLDLGSTKSEIVRAMAALPERFDPLGGHPMCGKEQSSLAQAEAGLFRNAPFAFVPLERTSPRARLLAERLAHLLGARSLWLDAERHDRWVAATSHVPYLVANALAGATPPECAPLAGSGFRSTARLAVSPEHVMMDILTTNSDNVLSACRRMRSRLEQIEQQLAAGDLTALRQTLAEGAANQRKIFNYPHGGQP